MYWFTNQNSKIVNQGLLADLTAHNGKSQRSGLFLLEIQLFSISLDDFNINYYAYLFIQVGFGDKI